MEWTEAYSTGVPSLDQHHQTLFRMVGDYRAALDDGRGEQVYELFLRSLSRYARAHFGLEEDCMTKYACPAARMNAEAHARFSKVLEESIGKFEGSGFDRDDATTLAAMLERWLLDHVARVDAQLRAYATRDAPGSA